MDADRFLTYSLQDHRLADILAATIEAVEPGRIVRRKLERIKLPPHRRLFLLGIGKAAEPMTIAAMAYCRDFTDALIITKHSSRTINNSSSIIENGRVTVIESGHPVPDERSLAAGQTAMDFVSHVGEDDLLICLISGGGSALVTLPQQGLSLRDIQLLTTSMLSNGANIEELNIVRCSVDRIKGGGLARATKGKILSLILSDVIGDNLEAIASGPTALTSTTVVRVSTILEKYGIAKIISSSKLNVIKERMLFDFSFIPRVKNVVIANNKLALQAAKKKAVEEGFFTEIIDMNMQGEAFLVGQNLAKTLKTRLQKRTKPFCLISGGETTVTVRGNGKGGRNQELALGAVEILDQIKNAMLIALATDGNDGPTEAAGAVVNGYTNLRANHLGMSAINYASRNDSYSFFDALGDLLKPGFTGTNVNDLIYLFGL